MKPLSAGRARIRSWSTGPSKAGGKGLGFNGGQLLGLAIGGCFCNDLHYVAHEMGLRLTSVEVDVMVSFEGSPLLATGAVLRARVSAAEKGADIEDLIKRAQAVSTVSNSLKRGIPVHFDGKA
ncbi:MAG TPA: OsmC family protein [Dongiaceae bacterium]|nr:OsmC family protein [Dongiaceae bacterium]